MKYAIVWMPRSVSTFNKNIEYLKQDWDYTTIKKFLERVNNALQTIGDDPHIYPFYKESKSVRRCIINERIILFYRISAQNNVEILLFWNTHQNPNKLKFR